MLFVIQLQKRYVFLVTLETKCRLFIFHIFIIPFVIKHITFDGNETCTIVTINVVLVTSNISMANPAFSTFSTDKDIFEINLGGLEGVIFVFMLQANQKTTQKHLNDALTCGAKVSSWIS